MQQTKNRSAFWQGIRDALPFTLVIAPFGLLFGVVATEAGLSLLQTMGMTTLVIAGASQFAAVQLMSDHAPTLVIIVTALAVNLRMAMYSASLTPHLGRAGLWTRAAVAYLMIDQTFALADRRFEGQPKEPLAAKLAYFFGTCATVCPLWCGMTLVGATIGGAIPEGLALDFAVPITFLAMVAPMLRSLPHLVAAGVSVTVALLTAWMPHNSGLFVASAAAMLAGAQVELMMTRAKARRREGRE